MDENDGASSDSKLTPPPKKVRNPFEKVLIENMHKPICSPGMCKVYKRKANGVFRWDIDQACTLVPADIVACNSQFEPSPDHALEKIAEEVNERFFSQEVVMPSPLEPSKKGKSPFLISKDDSSHVSFLKQETIVLRDVSAQTVLTLPPQLPPEVEKILEPFLTFTQDQNLDGDYETADVSLRRKLFFEEHTDAEHYDSEHTDDEIHIEQRPSSSFEVHTPVIFSPDLSRDFVAKGMIRTFGTPLQKRMPSNNKPGFRNKILDLTDFGDPCFSPIGCRTPKRDQHTSTASSLASVSISPVTKTASSDEDKNNFTSPESEVMAVCHDCSTTRVEQEGNRPCYYRTPPNNSVMLKRSASLKESPPINRKCSVSLSEKRSLSMSSLNRSRSVQKLDFSIDMSIDTSLHDQSRDSVPSPQQKKQASWSILEETSIQNLVEVETEKQQCRQIQSSTKIDNVNIINETPIKGRNKTNPCPREIVQLHVREFSPLHMSLDDSLDNCDSSLNLEDKKIDFNKVDLKFLTENTQIDNTLIKTRDYSSSFKRVDSGFNENTFYVNASSYYESAIRPSELTANAIPKESNGKTVLKEVSNINWMRVDSGYKEESSGDSMQFYPHHENVNKKSITHLCPERRVDDKENISEDLDRFLVQTNKNEAISMSDSLFTEDMTFNCNFSSTPSKSKPRKTFS